MSRHAPEEHVEDEEEAQEETPALSARAYTSRMVERLIPLSAIRPHPRNPNQHPESQVAQLADSHADLGQFEPIIVVEQPDGYLQVKGHGYVEGVRQAGDIAVKSWVLPPDTPEPVVLAIMLASNLHARNSYDDEALLAELLQELQDEGVRLSALGSSEEALDDLFAKLTPPDLDELAEQYGEEPEEDAFWPIIRVKVSPETKELYDSLLVQATGKTEGEQLAWLLERVNVAA